MPSLSFSCIELRTCISQIYTIIHNVWVLACIFKTCIKGQVVISRRQRSVGEFFVMHIHEVLCHLNHILNKNIGNSEYQTVSHKSGSWIWVSLQFMCEYFLVRVQHPILEKMADVNQALFLDTRTSIKQDCNLAIRVARHCVFDVCL